MMQHEIKVKVKVKFLAFKTIRIHERPEIPLPQPALKGRMQNEAAETFICGTVFYHYSFFQLNVRSKYLLHSKEGRYTTEDFKKVQRQRIRNKRIQRSKVLQIKYRDKAVPS